MSLTLPRGPLSKAPSSTVNYAISGPERRLYFDSFPRRVRAELGGQVVADTRQGMLLHETGLLPVLYIPDPDVDEELLEPTDHQTHCPFKGDAAYWTVRTGAVIARNAVWSYPDPIDSSAWLRGYKAIEWAAMDSWFDEDEEIEGHLRDPYHRVDVRRTSRRVRVLAGDDVLVETRGAMVLSETGLPNRYYLPREDVRIALQATDTTAVCPYKGKSRYWSVRHGSTTYADAAWSYESPLEEALRVAGHVCFLHEDLTIEAD